MYGKQIGIYKITSPSGKVYIGQTIDFDKRVQQYKVLSCKGQRKVFNSLMKYGFEKHSMELIEECSIELLNERERYYQDMYDVIGANGLNLKLTETTDRSGYYSIEARQQMSIDRKGKTIGIDNPFYGKSHSDETKQRLRVSNTGRKVSEETKQKIRETMKGRKSQKGN